jgi:hypothetical protein
MAILKSSNSGLEHQIVHGIVHGLGGYPLPGVLVTLFAGAALMIWEYLRLTASPNGSRYLWGIRLAAFALTLISVAMIACRFLAVEHPSL